MTCFPPLLPCAWRELVAVFLSVAAFDFFIYQGVIDVRLFSGPDWLFGSASLAGFCFAIPFIFWLGARHASFTVGRLAGTISFGACRIYNTLGVLARIVKGNFAASSSIDIYGFLNETRVFLQEIAKCARDRERETRKAYPQVIRP